MRKRKYLNYIRDKYTQLSAEYLQELFHGRNIDLLKALNGVLTTLNKEKHENITKDSIKPNHK
jgi:hypothetical protein